MKNINLKPGLIFIFLFMMSCSLTKKTKDIAIPPGINFEVERMHCKGSKERAELWRTARKGSEMKIRILTFEENIRNFPKDCMIDYDYNNAFKYAVELGDVDKSEFYAKEIFENYYGYQIMNDSMRYGAPSRTFHARIVSHLMKYKDNFDSVEFEKMMKKVKIAEHKGYQDWLEETRFLIQTASMENPDYTFLLNSMKYKNGIVELVKRGEIKLID